MFEFRANNYGPWSHQTLDPPPLLPSPSPLPCLPATTHVLPSPPLSAGLHATVSSYWPAFALPWATAAATFPVLAHRPNNTLSRLAPPRGTTAVQPPPRRRGPPSHLPCLLQAPYCCHPTYVHLQSPSSATACTVAAYTAAPTPTVVLSRHTVVPPPYCFASREPRRRLRPRAVTRRRRSSPTRHSSSWIPHFNIFCSLISTFVFQKRVSNKSYWRREFFVSLICLILVTKI